MQIDHLQKCAHEPCVCQVTPDQEYCSDHCRESSAAHRDSCRCSHIDCAVEPAEADPLAQPA